jgi:hypothetical protein
MANQAAVSIRFHQRLATLVLPSIVCVQAKSRQFLILSNSRRVLIIRRLGSMVQFKSCRRGTWRPKISPFSSLGYLLEFQNRVGAFVICDLAKEFLQVLQFVHWNTDVLEFVSARIVERVLRGTGFAPVSRKGIVILDRLAESRRRRTLRANRYR